MCSIGFLTSSEFVLLLQVRVATREKHEFHV